MMYCISFHFRNLPLAQINITSVLLSYNIEVINALTCSISIPILFVYVIHPLYYYLAHTFVFIVWSLATLIPAVAIAISCFQILYVTNFSSSFTLSPEKIGWLTFTVLVLGCLPPHLVIIEESSWRGEHATQGTAFLTGQPYQDSRVEGFLKEKKRALGKLCQIFYRTLFQNFTIKCCI